MRLKSFFLFFFLFSFFFSSFAGLFFQKEKAKENFLSKTLNSLSEENKKLEIGLFESENANLFQNFTLTSNLEKVDYKNLKKIKLIEKTALK